MKKRHLVRAVSILLASAFMSTSAFAYSKWWEVDADGNWTYRMADGSLAKTAWIHDEDDGEWYLIGDDGYMRTGVFESSGRYYLLDMTRGTGTYGRLLKDGMDFRGVRIKADTGVELEGALSEETIAGLRGAGVDFSRVPSVSGTQKIENGVVRDDPDTRGRASTPLPAPDSRPTP